MVESITITPAAKNMPSMSVHGDAADGFIFGLAAGALLTIYLMAQVR